MNRSFFHVIKNIVFYSFQKIFYPIDKLVGYHLVFIKISTWLDRLYSFWIMNEFKNVTALSSEDYSLGERSLLLSVKKLV